MIYLIPAPVISIPGLLDRIPLATALRSGLRSGYTLAQLRHDVLAGITVGIVAVPLAMALAIACGAPPQHGLYTSIIAGAVIALTGGSAVNISGPTAAFVVILLPVSHQYGLGGLLTSAVMAGVILLLLGIFRLGRFIRYIPYPVTTGFTAGIAVVIAVVQVKDFLGLDVFPASGHFIDQLQSIFTALPTIHLPDLAIGMLTFVILRFWPAMNTHIPSHLVAIAVASLLAWFGAHQYEGFQVATIGSRFSYEIGGIIGHGIPAYAPHFIWPWELPNAEGQVTGLSLNLIRTLLAPAFTIALLGAIESLLCAVVADSMAGTRHDPDAELVGQGLGNLIAPFFGAIPATAAIARTATSVRSGGRTPVAAVTHSLVILLTVLVFAQMLSYVPMASLSALLILVAWNMGEAKQFVHIVKISPKSDVAVLLICFFFTVVFDMVTAVGVGVVLAAVMFIRRMTELTGTTLLDHKEHEHLNDLPDHVAVYDIDGPLFFGAAEKTVSVLHHYNRAIKVIIMDMTDVPMMDITGIIAVKDLIDVLHQDGIMVVIACLARRIEEKLVRAGIRVSAGQLAFCNDMHEARAVALAATR